MKYSPDIISILDLRKAVQDAGYEAVTEEEIGRFLEEMRKARKRMLIVWAFAIPLIVQIPQEVVFGVVWPNETIYNPSIVLLVMPVIFWAFIYNTIAMSIAIFGLLHPITTELRMAISSVFVVTNANLLERENIRPSYVLTS